MERALIVPIVPASLLTEVANDCIAIAQDARASGKRNQGNTQALQDLQHVLEEAAALVGRPLTIREIMDDVMSPELAPLKPRARAAIHALAENVGVEAKRRLAALMPDLPVRGPAH